MLNIYRLELVFDYFLSSFWFIRTRDVPVIFDGRYIIIIIFRGIQSIPINYPQYSRRDTTPLYSITL